LRDRDELIGSDGKLLSFGLYNTTSALPFFFQAIQAVGIENANAMTERRERGSRALPED
jgi:hypothetical protein